MATLLEQSKRLKKLTEKSIERQLFKAVRSVEDKIIQLNQSQLAIGRDKDNVQVGVYADITAKYAEEGNVLQSKDAGSPYNFQWSGDFFDGFNLSVSGVEATISSKGVGSGGKKEFLTTSNLFGLNEENLAKIIQSDILPFIQKHAKSVLGI